MPMPNNTHSHSTSCFLGGSEVQAHPQLHNKSKANLGYMRLRFKTKANRRRGAPGCKVLWVVLKLKLHSHCLDTVYVFSGCPSGHLWGLYQSQGKSQGLLRVINSGHNMNSSA